MRAVAIGRDADLYAPAGAIKLHTIFWTIGLAALVALVAPILVLVFIRETLPRERRQKFRLSTTIGNFGSLFRHKRVFSYMLASGFSFAGMFSFLSAVPFVYIDLNGVSPQNFGYYFVLNVVFLFILTLTNSRFVARFGAQSMFRLGLAIQFGTGLWMIGVLALHLGFIPLVVGVALFVGCVAMVTSNGMAVILEDFPHMAGTASSLAGTLRFGVGAVIGALLSLATFDSAWPMVLSMAVCSSVTLFCYLYASRPRKSKVRPSLD